MKRPAPVRWPPREGVGRPPRRVPLGGGHRTTRNLTEMARGGQSNREIERAAGLLWAVISAEGRFIEAGREFLASADGLDRAAVVRCAAERLAQTLPNATVEQAERAVWKDMRRLFGWCDLAGLEPGGHA
jgi:hypothetical protein